MNYKINIILLLIVLSAYSFTGFRSDASVSFNENDSLVLPGESHLKNIKQLTFGGENAECYFSPDGKKFVFQTTRNDYECDQIYLMNTDGSDQRLVSTGTGRTTCAYYMPDNTTLLYASTHLGGPDCPPKPDFSKGYVWALYDTYDIFTADENGNILSQLTSTEGYDAEATISPVGDKIVFTSTRNGDIDLYSMNLDGSNVTQLTNEPGYDGGAFYSYDGTKIIYRRTSFKSDEEILAYKELLAEGLIRPSNLEIWVMDADGGNKKQITNNGAANFAPYWFPDGNRILFCSNVGDDSKRNFDIYMISLDGTGLEKITQYGEFDGFPMFSPDGKKLVFCSNRNGSVKGETNVFICDWEE
ncbi:MAG: PD40 domain-containing protein [Ignavibacteriae bacterium]|nr:PD40 domain-containing protein [Ignavibacteriota bacterium]